MGYLQMKVPHMNSFFPPWRDWFPLYHPALLCRLRVLLWSAPWLVQILCHDVLEQYVYCITVVPRASRIDGRWLGHTWSSLQLMCFSQAISDSPSRAWGHLHKDQGVGEGVDLTGFIGLAHVQALLPPCTSGCFPQFCWGALHPLEGTQEQGGPG